LLGSNVGLEISLWVRTARDRDPREKGSILEGEGTRGIVGDKDGD
jgi:hypothetical protein